MPELLTRTLGKWEAVSENREHLVNSRGIVIATIFWLRISGRWAYSSHGLMQVVTSKHEAKRRAEGICNG